MCSILKPIEKIMKQIFPSQIHAQVHLLLLARDDCPCDVGPDRNSELLHEHVPVICFLYGFVILS